MSGADRADHSSLPLAVQRHVRQVCKRFEDALKAGLEQITDGEPTSEFAAQVAEECRRLLESLGDAELKSIALWKMEGYTADEIAAKLGCAPSTIERRLRLIRTIWDKESAS